MTDDEVLDDYMTELLDNIQSGECPHYRQFQDTDHVRLGSKRLIHAAVTSGHLWLVQYLTDHGCDLNGTTATLNYTPILLAVKRNKQDIIKFLLSHDVNMNVTSGVEKRTPLTVAVNSTNGELLDLILTGKGVDVNAKNAHLETALSIAVRKNEFELVQTLLKAGANCNIVDSRGSTPLMHAAIHGNRDITHALIHNGALVDLQNARMETALLFATYRSTVICSGSFKQKSCTKKLFHKYMKDPNTRPDSFNIRYHYTSPKFKLPSITVNIWI